MGQSDGDSSSALSDEVTPACYTVLKLELSSVTQFLVIQRTGNPT